jgi:hypothetical protein
MILFSKWGKIMKSFPILYTLLDQNEFFSHVNIGVLRSNPSGLDQVQSFLVMKPLRVEMEGNRSIVWRD